MVDSNGYNVQSLYPVPNIDLCVFLNLDACSGLSCVQILLKLEGV